ncbi:hypothetical protein BD410DRAFT_794538 [Rickenella mellea]|uniref:Uncharacterized protein n=1 Tax=Rickenella mellea TaxID=50990 RepID=A0A4Y7PRN3_9AGAM|nr:hypothetical protein BD410DRAFT_794538 [Rickenella mellea]
MSCKLAFHSGLPGQQQGGCSCTFPNLHGMSKDMTNALLRSLATLVDPATSSEVGGYRLLEVTWFKPGSDAFGSHHSIWFGPRETPLLAIATAPWYHLCCNDLTSPAPPVWADVLLQEPLAVKGSIHEHGTVKPDKTQQFEEDFKHAYASMVSKVPLAGEVKQQECGERLLQLLKALDAKDSFYQNHPMDIMKAMIFPGATPGMDWLPGRSGPWPRA